MCYRASGGCVPVLILLRSFRVALSLRLQPAPRSPDHLILQDACVFPNRTVLARRSAQLQPAHTELYYDMGAASYSNKFRGALNTESAAEKLLHVQVLDGRAFEAATRGVRRVGHDAAIRGAYGFGVNFWHSTLEGPFGLEMWSHLRGHSAKNESCPNLDLILANTCLDKRGARRNRCLDTEAPWDDGYDLLYARSVVGDLEQNVNTFWDMTAGRCYGRVFVGAPKLGFPFNQFIHQRLMDGYGDCVMQRTHGFQRKDANTKDPFILLVQRNSTCKRRVTNFEDLFAAVVRRGFKKVASVDFSLLTREQQLEKASMADVMIQPHGAGLGWMSVMRKGGVVVELNDDNPDDYNAWANWNNIMYVKVQADQDGTLSDCRKSANRHTSPSTTVRLIQKRSAIHQAQSSSTGNDNPMRVPVQRFEKGLDEALAKLGKLPF